MKIPEIVQQEFHEIPKISIERIIALLFGKNNRNLTK